MAQATNISSVTVFGGTGFLGGEIVKTLAAARLALRVAVRHPDNVMTADVSWPGQIEPVYADVRDARCDEILDLWRKEVGPVADVVNLTFKQMDITPGGKPIDIQLRGRELDDLVVEEGFFEVLEGGSGAEGIDAFSSRLASTL